MNTQAHNSGAKGSGIFNNFYFFHLINIQMELAIMARTEKLYVAYTCRLLYSMVTF